MSEAAALPTEPPPLSTLNDAYYIFKLGNSIKPKNQILRFKNLVFYGVQPIQALSEEKLEYQEKKH